MSDPKEALALPTEADEDSEICLEDALDEARECMSVGQYDIAINIVEMLLESEPEKYNPEEDLRLENAPLYFIYGSALFQSAKLQEQDVLIQVIKQMTENPDKGAISQEQAALLADSVMSTTSSSAQNEEDLDPKQGPSESKEVEVETFELAWEWLDFARVIYEMALKGEYDKELTDALKKKYNLAMAEVLLMLGQLGMELENTDIYLKDLGDCLELRKEYLDLNEDESKYLLAESWLNLATGQQLSGDPEGALRSYFMATELQSAMKQSEKGEKLKKLIEQGVFEAQRMASDSAETASSKEAVNEMIHFQIRNRSNPSGTTSSSSSGSAPAASAQPVTLMAPRKKKRPADEAEAGSKEEEPSLKRHQAE